MDVLVLVEFLEDVPRAVQLAGRGRARLIALTPEVMDALDARGAPYGLATASAEIEDLDAIAYENLDRVERLRRLVDNKIREVLPHVAQLRFSPIRCHAHEILTVLDAVSFRCRNLEYLVTVHAPSRIVYFVSAMPARTALLFRPGESIWSALCGLNRVRNRHVECSWAEELEWVGYPSQCSISEVQKRILAARPADSVRSLLRRYAPARRLLSAARGARTFIRDSTGTRVDDVRQTGATRILFLGSGSELGLLGGALARSPDLDIWSWASPLSSPSRGRVAVAVDPRQTPDVSPEALSELGDWFAGDREVSELHTWCECDCLPVLRPTWEWLFGPGFRQTLRWYVAALDCLRRLRPDVVVHGEVGLDGWTRTVLEAADHARIATVFYQWGGNYGYVLQPYLALTELQSRYAFMYTKGAADGIARTPGRSIRVRAETKAVGSVFFSHLAQQVEDHGRRRRKHSWSIVYVSSALKGSCRYGPHLCLDDALYYSAERQIIVLLARAFPDEVLVKLHPGNVHAVDPIRRWIARERIRVRVSVKPLDTMLDQASLWVVDSPATALQQVALTQGPIVYVHLGEVVFYPEAEVHLKERAEFVDFWAPAFAERFVDALRRALASGPSAARSRSAFVDQYVAEAGGSTESVVARIKAELRSAAQGDCSTVTS